MDTITTDVMVQAAMCVHEADAKCPNIDTVTIELNGQHGGADVIVSGLIGDDEYRRAFEVH